MTKTSTPAISVITPVYNTEKYIAECINSILKQTFKDFELIIIDDCSTDRTWSIVKKFALKDTRIRAFKNKKNLGIAGNRNKGLSKARGKYVVWQDADDVSMPYRLKMQFEYMERHKRVGIAGGYLKFFNEHNPNMGVRKYATDDTTLRSKIFRYSPVAQPAAIIRRQCLVEVGGYNLAYPPSEDLDMSFRIGEKYRFGNIPKIMIKYRDHPNSVTYRGLRKMEKNTTTIRKVHFGNPHYNATFGDKVYNLLQMISIYIIPAKWKIWLFKRIRDNK